MVQGADGSRGLLRREGVAGCVRYAKRGAGRHARLRVTVAGWVPTMTGGGIMVPRAQVCTGLLALAQGLVVDPP